MRFGTLVHATALALALLPAVAAAQVADDEPLPDPIPAAGRDRRRRSAWWGRITEVGVQASVPIGPRAAFEMAVGWLPRVIYDVEHVLAQAQFRVPFRAHLAIPEEPADRGDPHSRAKETPLR